MTVDICNNYLQVKECESWLTKEGFRRMFSLIGRNSQGVGTSPFSVYVDNLTQLKSINRLEKKKLDKLIDKIYSKLDKSNSLF